MSLESILPAGISLRENAEPIRLQIAKAEIDGPWLTVYVNRMGVEDFRRLTSRLKRPAGIREGSKAERDYEAKFTDQLVRRSIAGWDGMTVANFASLLPPKYALEDSEDRPAGYEIPFSHELAVWIQSNAFGDRWADKIMTALRDGSEEDLIEEEEVKN